MFDSALPKTRRCFRFGDVSAAVRLVDDDPGAVQVMENGRPELTVPEFGRTAIYRTNTAVSMKKHKQDRHIMKKMQG